MTYPTREHEELLRHALRAAADSVEPAGDGLERIRARLTSPRPAVAAWMMSGAEPAALRFKPVLTWFRLRIGPVPGRIGPVFGRIGPTLGRIGPAFGRIGPLSSRIGPALGWAGQAAARLRPRGDAIGARPWLRPAAALAAFVVIIGSGALAINVLQQHNQAPSSLIGTSASQGVAGQTSGGAVSGGGHKIVPSVPFIPFWPLHGAGPTPAPIPPSPKVSPAPAASCTPTVTPSRSTPPSASPSPSQSTSPTPTPSGSPTPTDTGSPSPSGSPTPADSSAPSMTGQSPEGLQSPGAGPTVPASADGATATASPPGTQPC